MSFSDSLSSWEKLQAAITSSKIEKMTSRKKAAIWGPKLVCIMDNLASVCVLRVRQSEGVCVLWLNKISVLHYFFFISVKTIALATATHRKEESPQCVVFV
jgi:hypothetical protein